MKSRIKFSLDFDTKKEIIEATVVDSDDVRDSLAKAFTQSFNGSSLCQIKFHGNGENGEIHFRITPIRDDAEGRALAAELMHHFSPQPANDTFPGLDSDL